MKRGGTVTVAASKNKILFRAWIDPEQSALLTTALETSG